MARYQERLLLVDGFAGPGRYLGGEDGSPVIMLKAYLEHAQKARLERTRFDFFFIERDDDRFARLEAEVDRLRPFPSNVTGIPVHDEYGLVMGGIIGDAANRVPTFAFIDPFGYKDSHFEFTSRILGFPRCEVLIFLPTPDLGRFIAKPALAHVFDLLFGGRGWEGALELSGDERLDFLRDEFRRSLEGDADFVRSFEIVTDEGRGYHLFFATNAEMGLIKWKEAAWIVDPVDGMTYREKLPDEQMTLFEVVPGTAAPLKLEPNTAPLLRELADHFGDRTFTIEEAERFTTLETRFLAEGHLKNRTLREAERGGALHVVHRTGRTGFPAGTLMRFVRR